MKQRVPQAAARPPRAHTGLDCASPLALEPSRGVCGDLLHRLAAQEQQAARVAGRGGQGRPACVGALRVFT